MIPQSGWGVKNFLNTHPTIDSLLCLKRISYFATYYTCIVSAKLIEIWLAPRNEVEKETATHSSFLAWRIPGVGEPGGLPSMGLHRVRHDWSYLAAVSLGFWIFFSSAVGSSCLSHVWKRSTTKLLLTWIIFCTCSSCQKARHRCSVG